VVKLGKAFSILVVLTLLILLAPVAILAPPQNVSAAGEEVVQEVEATFSFTETTNGSWDGFVAGGAGIDPPGLGLTQFSRQDVVRQYSISGCEYRNYTTGSGTVVGTGLSGSMTLAWQTLKFNEPYSGPGGPYYVGATDFGFLLGRGHINEGGDDDFAFVFIADFDSDDTMSNFSGKGFMVSVEESGTFAGHKIIGDFEINKTGDAYSGNFHLRNYPPSEVFDLGHVYVQGAVLQETYDTIAPLGGLELVNVTADVPMSTPTGEPTVFEDIAWGKDPTKYVTGGHMGINGTMNISRNTVIHNTQHGAGPVMVHIQGTAGCRLHIDDTYAVTKNDGSTHGDMWYFLLLSIPYQELPVSVPPVFFTQMGYTFGPFGMLNPATESYAGSESFALATIQIQASTYDAQQMSDDQSYGLCPHPNITSVTPSSGYRGETLNVVIKGKYFLRAGPDAPGSSWSLGPGITVNSWSLKNSSPIDNEIQACITIDSDAATTTRDANVTACFHYENATYREYLSGELAGAFTVKALEGATLQGQGIFAAGANSEPFRVKLFEAGTNWNTDNLTWDGTAITSTAGTFIISNLPSGTYDIGIKGATSLSRQETNVVLNSTKVVNFTVVKGDADDDDYIGGADFGLFSIAYDSWPGQPNWDPRCDFDSDDYVGGSDFGLFSMSYDTWGDLLGKVVF